LYYDDTLFYLNRKESILRKVKVERFF